MTRDTDRSPPMPCDREVAAIGEAYAGLDAIKQYLDGAVRGQMPDVAETVFGALSRKIEEHDTETRRQLLDVRERLDTLIGLVTTLSEERMRDRQALVDFERWKTSHERGNSHCETCPYQPAETVAL